MRLTDYNLEMLARVRDGGIVRVRRSMGFDAYWKVDNDRASSAQSRALTALRNAGYIKVGVADRPVAQIQPARLSDDGAEALRENKY